MEPPPRSGITSRSGLPRFASLSDALREHGIPLENHSFIRRFTDAIGIEAYFGTTEYIKAVRTGAGPDLNIAYGWSNGFVSEEEARLATGDTTQVWTSSRATGLGGDASDARERQRGRTGVHLGSARLWHVPHVLHQVRGQRQLPVRGLAVRTADVGRRVCATWKTWE